MAEAAELITRIEAHVGAATGGWANARALAVFNRLVVDLSRKLDHPHGERHLEMLCFWGETLYSTRRHRRWERCVAPVRQIILDELARCRVLLR